MAAAAMLAGCGSVIGERATTVLTDTERNQLEADLAAARARAAAAGAPPAGGADKP